MTDKMRNICVCQNSFKDEVKSMPPNFTQLLIKGLLNHLSMKLLTIYVWFIDICRECDRQLSEKSVVITKEADNYLHSVDLDEARSSWVLTGRQLLFSPKPVLKKILVISIYSVPLYRLDIFIIRKLQSWSMSFSWSNENDLQNFFRSFGRIHGSRNIENKKKFRSSLMLHVLKNI